MKRFTSFLPIILFLLLTIFVFRQYVFSGKVPFAGNLLVSFYQPWKTYPSPQYPNGPANKPIGFDSLRIFYPLRSLTIDSLKHFQLPLWNPYDFAGNTQLATYQSAVFFPLTPLFLLLPQIDAWSLTVFLEPLLASLFTYFFLRSLSLSRKASTIGALAFGFSGGIIVLSEESFMSVYSLMVLPLILLGIQKFFQTGKIKWFSLVVFSMLWSIFSGWFQSTFYVVIFSFTWLVFLLFQTKDIKRFLFVIVSFIIAFLISAPHLVPNVESYLYSARGTTDAKFLFDIYLLPVWHLITYIAPDFFGNPGTYTYFDQGFYYEKIMYIGITGLFLGLFSLFTLKKTATEWFFNISWLISVSLGLALPTSWFLLYNLHLPLISTILPSRIFLLSGFCLAVMASYGLDSAIKKPSKKALFATVSVMIVVVGLTWYFLHNQRLVDPTGKFATISYRNMILPTIFAAATVITSLFFLFKKKIFKRMTFACFLIITLAGIIYFSDKYLYFSEKQFVFPTTPIVAQLTKISGENRVWSFGDGFMERNFATYYHLQSPEGYDSFYIRSYGELLQASQNGGKFTTNIPRADAQLTGVSKLSEIANNSSLQKVMDILGVKYIFAKKSQEDADYLSQNSNLFVQTWSDGKYVIYENKQVIQRVFLTDDYKVVSDSKKDLPVIFDKSTDLSKTVILNEDPHLQKSSSSFTGSAIISSYAPEKIVIDTTSNKQVLLFLSDNNYPGWVATIDGKTTKIFTADHTFRSIIIPSGKHIVIFTYNPKSVSVGFLLSGLGVLLFIIVGFTIKRKQS